MLYKVVIGDNRLENRHIGVITGDLFKSTKGYDRGYLYQNIMSVLKDYLNDSRRYDIKKFEFFRGDSFQITLTDPTNIIEIATYIRAYLISLTDEDNDDANYDARMSLAVYQMNRYSGYEDSVYEKVYISSGRTLDNMSKNNLLEFNSDVPELEHSVKGSIILLDSLLSLMSKPQAAVLRLSIENGRIDATEIAKTLKKTRQNIYKIISRAKIENIMEYLRVNKKYMQNSLMREN